VQTPDVGATIGGGVTLGLDNDAALAIAAQYYFTDTQFDAWSFSLGGTLPASSFGLFDDGTAGLLSLQLNGTPKAGVASLRFNLPLN